MQSTQCKWRLSSFSGASSSTATMKLALQNFHIWARLWSCGNEFHNAKVSARKFAICQWNCYANKPAMAFSAPSWKSFLSSWSSCVNKPACLWSCGRKFSPDDRIICRGWRLHCGWRPLSEFSSHKQLFESLFNPSAVRFQLKVNFRSGAAHFQHGITIERLFAMHRQQQTMKR